MAILPIRQLGDPILREVSRPVAGFDEALARLAGDMIETMYDAPGVGLAAPQVGVSLRLIVFDDNGGEGARILANPEISDLEDEEIREEGCLSVRGPFSELARAHRLKARGFGPDGQPIEFVAEGLLARILQHECDHLDGTLFIDRLSSEARREVMRELREQELRGPGRRAGTARGS
jgi:peptide deformylase